MKIGICSDIHVHRRDQADQVCDLVDHINDQQNLDLLLCAGDLSHTTREVHSFLHSITLQCPRAWLPGNHDIWVIEAESELDSAEKRYRQTLCDISRDTNWHYHPSGPLMLQDGTLAVVGSMGWFTDPGYSEWFDADAGVADAALAVELADDLQESITRTDKARLIVVTHHVPHPDCLPPGDARQAEHNLHIAEVISQHAQRIALVVHGHKLRRYGPIEIGGIPYVAHPFGYPNQHKTPEDGFRIVDLGF